MLREFAGLLTRADHKYRADRLLYAEKAAPALRAAALAGADEVALANARIEAARGPLSPRAIAAVPASLQSDPGLLFARVQDARRANRTARGRRLARAGAQRSRRADRSRQMVERAAHGRARISRSAAPTSQAYELCAGAPTDAIAAHVDAAFHAGWIALRFLDDPAAAARHFAEASAVAMTPLAHRARQLLAGPRRRGARSRPTTRARFYQRAAAYPDRLLRPARRQAARPRRRRRCRARPRAVAQGAERWEAARIVELYFEAGLDDFAVLARLFRRLGLGDEAQIAALGEVLGAPRRRDRQRRLRQDRHRARLRARRSRVPDFRPARLLRRCRIRPTAPSVHRGRAAGERIRLARRLGRRRQGPDADPALDRAIDRAARGRAVRLAAPDRRPRLQPATRRRLSRAN